MPSIRPLSDNLRYLGVQASINPTNLDGLDSLLPDAWVMLGNGIIIFEVITHVRLQNPTSNHMGINSNRI